MNTADTVIRALSKLTGLGLDVALCGGWAEEAFGLAPARAHKDIDLVLLASTFSALDDHFAAEDLHAEIPAKRFAHKRAFVYAETMVEMYLVQSHNYTPITMFWGDTEYVWIKPLITTTTLNAVKIRAVTPPNLKRFRSSHDSHQPWRWRDAASVVRPGSSV